jgi:hypothetical protein
MAEEMQYMAKLGIDDADFLKALTDMEGAFKSFVTGSTLGLAAVGTAAIAATEHLIAMSRAAEDMMELSEVINVNVQDLQKFQYAAKLAGEEANAYDSMLAKMVLSASQASDATSKQAEAFRKLGVDPSGKSTSELFIDIAEALKGVDDAQTKAEISSVLLGKSWVEANKLTNNYVENLDKIEKQTYLTNEQVMKLNESNEKMNERWAKLSSYTDRATMAVFEVTDALSFQARGLEWVMGLWDQYTSKAAAVSGATKTETAYNRDAEALVAQMSVADKAGKAEQLKYLNDEYNAGNLTAEQYNAKRLELTGVKDAMVGGKVADILMGQSFGFDQSSQSGYYASGVNGSMGVNASPTQANAYQLQVAEGLYQKYYDQLTGDKWGQQAYRSEIARQLAYNEAASGYKSQDEAWAAVGYKQGTNITIINYNSGNASPEEIANASAEKMSRIIAGGV